MAIDYDELRTGQVPLCFHCGNAVVPVLVNSDQKGYCGYLKLFAGHCPSCADSIAWNVTGGKSPCCGVQLTHDPEVVIKNKNPLAKCPACGTWVCFLVKKNKWISAGKAFSAEQGGEQPDAFAA